MHGEKRNACRLLVGKLEGMRPRLGREDNIKMGLIEIGWGGMDWIVTSLRAFRLLLIK
jgi:hypothetical protein